MQVILTFLFVGAKEQKSCLDVGLSYLFLNYVEESIMTLFPKVVGVYLNLKNFKNCEFLSIMLPMQIC